MNRIINQLLTTHGANGGEFQLPPGSRAAVEAAVERILVDQGALHEHVQQLYESVRGHFPSSERLPDDVADSVVEHGLRVLSDAALAALMLNPVALHVLFDEIVDRLSDSWLTVMDREGRALWEAEGRPIPSFEAILRQTVGRQSLGVGGPHAQLHEQSDPGDDNAVERLRPPCYRFDESRHRKPDINEPASLMAVESAAPRWTWLDDLRAWLLVAPETTLKLVPIMSDDATDLEAVIETPATVRESCPWARALKIHRSEAVLTIQALGPEAPGSTSSLNVWVAERPEQAEVLANDQRIGFLDTSEAAPRLLLAVGR